MPDRAKILAVDDKPQNLFTMEKLLRTLDVDIYQANSGNEALGLVLEHEFCVAIVDVQMPEMDGYELVSILRSNRATATLPVIFVSAIFSDDYHHRKGYDAGAVDFMSKPFIPEILLSKVRVFIELYQQRRQLQETVAELNRANARVTGFNEQLERTVAERTAELRRAYQTLEKLDRTKSNFIHIAGHELRTPLTLIRGYASLLEAKIAHIPEAEDILRGIINGEQRLLEVVNNMLDIARIDNATLETVRRPIDLKDIIQAVCAEYADSLAARKLTLTQECGELPRIEGDIELLRKLFHHLVSNAIKFTPDGGSIFIRGCRLAPGCLEDPARNAVQISIIDSGIGIDPTDQELIFEKFYQTGPVRLHSSGKTKFKGGGPGLGLAIARGIASVHGGRIWAESPGYDEQSLPGSKFHVLLPVFENYQNGK